MKITTGWYINITTPDDMDGISQKDFEGMYRFIDELSKKNKTVIL